MPEGGALDGQLSMQLNHSDAEAPDVVSEDTDASTGEW